MYPVSQVFFHCVCSPYAVYIICCVCHGHLGKPFVLVFHDITWWSITVSHTFFVVYSRIQPVSNLSYKPCGSYILYTMSLILYASCVPCHIWCVLSVKCSVCISYTPRYTICMVYLACYVWRMWYTQYVTIPSAIILYVAYITYVSCVMHTICHAAILWCLPMKVNAETSGRVCLALHGVQAFGST